MPLKSFFMLTLILSLSACGITSPVKTPTISSYTLTRLGHPKGHRLTNKTILVSRPVASPGYTSRNMVYVNRAYQIRTFARNQWVAPPAKILLPLITETLDRTRAFRAVVAPPFSGKTDYRLDTQLLELKQDFTRRPSRIVLRMQAELINTKTHKVIRTQRFVSIVPAKRDTPYGGVQAANRAALQIVTKLADFVTKNR